MKIKSLIGKLERLYKKAGNIDVRMATCQAEGEDESSNEIAGIIRNEDCSGKIKSLTIADKENCLSCG
jgi:hypothetical protein